MAIQQFAHHLSFMMSLLHVSVSKRSSYDLYQRTVQSELQRQAVGLDRGYLTLPVNREKCSNGSVAARKFQCFVHIGGGRIEFEWITGSCANG